MEVVVKRGDSKRSINSRPKLPFFIVEVEFVIFIRNKTFDLGRFLHFAYKRLVEKDDLHLTLNEKSDIYSGEQYDEEEYGTTVHDICVSDSMKYFESKLSSFCVHRYYER